MEKIQEELIEILEDKLMRSDINLNLIHNDFYREERKGYVNGLHAAIALINSYFYKKKKDESANNDI